MGRWTYVLVLVGLFGCDSDDPVADLDAAVEGDPTLTFPTVDEDCARTLPVPTRDQLMADNVQLATIVLKGVAAGGGNIAPNTPVSIYVADATGQPGGDGLWFETARAAGPGTDMSMSNGLTFTGQIVTDEVLCLRPGQHTVNAKVGDVVAQNTVTIKCVPPAEYIRDCTDGTDEGPDYGADLGLSDAAPTDGDVDARPPLQPWAIECQALMGDANIIGTKGSVLRPDNVVLNFLVHEDGVPLEGVDVTVDVQGAFGEAVAPEELVTDAAGMVATRLTAGGIPGVTVVTAVAERVFRGMPVQVETQCDAVSIVGGTPSHGGFTLSCEDAVLPAFSAGINPGACTSCTALVSSRLGERVSEGAAVIFQTEAGTLDGMIPVGDDGATSEFCVTEPPPVDTQPEPYEVEAGYDADFNPRDGLVRIIALTIGEEAFRDEDGDGLFDEAIDIQLAEHQLTEAYVDMNDNGRRDPGEPWRDTDGDGEFTIPDSDWQREIEIWTSTTVLWVGDLVDGDQPCSRVSFACAAQPEGACVEGENGAPPRIVGVDGAFEVTADFRDIRGNCLDGLGQGTASLAIDGRWVIRGQEENVPLRDHCFSGPDGLPLGDRITWTVASRLEAGDRAQDVRDELSVGVEYLQAGGAMGRARCVVDVETSLPAVEE